MRLSCHAAFLAAAAAVLHAAAPELDPAELGLLPVPPDARKEAPATNETDAVQSCIQLLSTDGPTRYTLQVHENGLLWCPNAKAGTSSIIDALGLAWKQMPGRAAAAETDEPGATAPANSWRRAQDLGLEQIEQVCNDTTKKVVSFTMVRDPYDRLASAYLDKVVLQLGIDGFNSSGCLEPRRRLLAQGVEKPTFKQFVDTLAQVDLMLQDPHTLPYSYRCGTDKFHYDLIGNLRTFDDDMTTLFERLGLDQSYAPVHTRDLGELSVNTWPWEMELINQTIRDFGLRQDVLFLHGRERVEYFYDEGTRDKVRNGWWKDDVAMFGEY